MKYKMLVLSTTITTLEAESDAQALAIFRKNPKARELRADRLPARDGLPAYPLGRLLAYKDLGHHEHLANIETDAAPREADLIEEWAHRPCHTSPLPHETEK